MNEPKQIRTYLWISIFVSYLTIVQITCLGEVVRHMNCLQIIQQILISIIELDDGSPILMHIIPSHSATLQPTAQHRERP